MRFTMDQIETERRSGKIAGDLLQVARRTTGLEANNQTDVVSRTANAQRRDRIADAGIEEKFKTIVDQLAVEIEILRLMQDSVEVGNVKVIETEGFSNRSSNRQWVSTVC